METNGIGNAPMAENNPINVRVKGLRTGCLVVGRLEPHPGRGTERGANMPDFSVQLRLSNDQAQALADALVSGGGQIEIGPRQWNINSLPAELTE